MTFRELGEKEIAHALERSETNLDAEQLRGIARRAGAPVALRDVDRIAVSLLRILARDEEPAPAIRRALLDGLGNRTLSDAEQAAAEWLGTSAERRGRALRDLLLLADRLPARERGDVLGFPPFTTEPG